MLDDDDVGIFDDEDNNPWTTTSVPNKKIWPVVSKEGFRISGVTLRDDLLAWMEEHVGPRVTLRQLGVWRASIPLGSTTDTVFWFKDPDKAVLFKLTWG